MIRPLLALLLASLTVLSYGQVASVQSGDWNDTNTWDCGCVPDFSDGAITITDFHTVDIPNGVTADVSVITVSSDAILNILSGGVLIVRTDMTVTVGDGFFIFDGYLNVNAGAILENRGTLTGSNINTTISGTYRHNVNGGTIPSAQWASGSTLEVTGATSIKPNGFGQTFYNVVWNCPQTASISLEAELLNILNDFTVSGTGTNRALIMSTTTTTTLNIGGNLSVTNDASFGITPAIEFTVDVGGDLILSSSRSNYAFNFTSNGNPVTVNVAGDFVKTNAGGVMFASGDGVGTLNVAGDFSATAGVLTRGTLGTGNIVFNGTQLQQYVDGANVLESLNYTINTGAIVDLGTGVLGQASGGAGTFVCNGEVRLGSTDALGAVSGNIKITSKTFNAGSTIVYNGGAAQSMAFSTNAVVNTIIDNASGVSLVGNVTIGGDLTLTNGNLSVGSNTLTLGGSVTANGNAITVTSASSIVVNGSGTFGTFPFPAASQSLANFTLDRAGETVTFGVGVSISGAVTLTNGTLAFPGQNLTLTGTFTASGGALSANSSSNLTIGGTGAFGELAFDTGGNTLGTLTLNRSSSGTASLNSTLIIANALNLTQGDFTNTSGLTMDHDATLTRTANAQLLGQAILTAAGEFYNVTYAGSGAMSTGIELPETADDNLNDLTINTNGTVTLTKSIIVHGDVNLLNSTFDANGFNITLDGEPGVWNRQSGTFAAGTSTVTVTGNITITAASTPQFHNLTLSNGSTLTTSAGQVNISGNLLVNGGSTFNHNNGTIVFNGSSGQNFGGGGKTYNNVTVNKSGGNLQITNNVSLTGVLSIASATTVVTGGVLTLLSTSDGATGNGSIGPIPSGASISGSVSVRRFMSEEGRIYRYISSPVQSMTVQQLQASGIIISGTFTGADPCPGCLPSMYRWNETLDGDNSVGYEAFPINSNSETMEVGRGYATFVPDNVIPGNVTINYSGTINSGTIALPVTYTLTGNSTSDGFNLVGNPYPSSISWDDIVDRTNISPVIAVRDNGAGGVFRYWDGTGTTSNGIPDGIIATGQAFWVRTTGSGPSLTIHESAKSSQTGVFFRKDQRNEIVPTLAISLKKGADEDVAFYKVRKNAKAELDDLDGPKLNNGIFDISTLTPEGTSMAINATDKPLCGEPLRLRIQDVTNGTYQISAQRMGLFEGYQVTLVDNYTSSNFDLSSGDEYEFSVTNDAATKAADRFSVILTEPAIDPGNLIAEWSEGACADGEYKVTLSGVQPGVTYFAELDGKVLGDSLENTSTEPMTLSIPASELEVGVNELTIKGSNYCTAVTMNDVVAVEHDVIYTALSTDKSTCGAEMVTLEASGAPESGSYNWYEEETSAAPIEGQHASTFETPPLTKSLTYYVAAVNSLGCEGPRVAVQANVTDGIEAVAISGEDTGELVSSYDEGNQWLFNGAVIEGETGPTYTATESGTYTVVVNVDGCETSASVDYLVTGVDEIGSGRLLQVDENPFVTELRIRVVSPAVVTQMSVFDNVGAHIGNMELRRGAGLTEGVIDMTHAASGMYFVRAIVKDDVYTLKVIKK